MHRSAHPKLTVAFEELRDVFEGEADVLCVVAVSVKGVLKGLGEDAVQVDVIQHLLGLNHLRQLAENKQLQTHSVITHK